MWRSPASVNLYCSIVVRPRLAPGSVPQLGLVAALPIARAIEETTGLTPALKWPNDVLVAGRKVVGILTEMEAELEQVRFAILGIGVNVNAPAATFPPELRDKATSLAIEARRPIDRVRFTAALLTHLERDYKRFLTGGFAAVRDEWEALSALQGKQVSVHATDTALTGTAVGLDDDGALRLQDRSGTIHRIIAGDVTLRRDR